MKRARVFFILLLAFSGIAVSTYLVQHEQTGDPLICNIQSLSGCNEVASSSYSRLFGISLAQLGLLYYTMVFVIAICELVMINQLLRRALQGFALLGLLSALYSTYTQVFLIQALCIYCVVSAGIMVLVLILAGGIEPISRAALSRVLHYLHA